MPQRNHPYLIALAFVLSVGSLAIWIVGWNAFWTSLGIPSMSPPFADMRTIQGALTTLAQGLDPTLTNPGDPWGRLMNYPKVWTFIASMLAFGNETHFIAYNLIVLIGFYGLCAHLIWRYPSKSLLLMIFSPACLLAVERGNNDLLVFILVTLFALLGNFKGLIAGAAAIALKIYPVVLIPIAFVSKTRVIAWALTFSAIGILWFNLADLSAIQKGNTANGDLAYGTTVAATLAYRNLGATHFYWDTVLYPLTISASLLFTQWLNLFGQLDRLRESDPLSVNLFYTGASVFFFTFILSSNWDYRLVYLLLLFPALSQIDLQVRWVRLLKILMVVCGSYLWLAHYPYGWFVSGYAKVFVATLCGYLTLRTLLREGMETARRYFPSLA